MAQQGYIAGRGDAPDGTVLVRTSPIALTHDFVQPRHDHAWHQLTFAARGHLEIVTDDARRLVPADRAVWVPAGTPHVEHMRAPITLRSLYLARAAVPDPHPRVRTIAVSPLLRELVQHISRIGALDVAIPAHARLVGVLLDLLQAAEDVPLELPTPRDPRARKLAELVAREPGATTDARVLAKRAGASLRTLERIFAAETGVSLGTWRRRVRLFHALRLLEGGASVTSVALDAGYATPSAFAHAFAAQFGRPPSASRSTPRATPPPSPARRPPARRHRSRPDRP
ncbi:MAG TPA: helix-turn-helix transcriptional regulator [Kofleriaceae bacterium]|jgi:AraC-like DNA-binding protein